MLARLSRGERTNLAPGSMTLCISSFVEMNWLEVLCCLVVCGKWPLKNLTVEGFCLVCSSGPERKFKVCSLYLPKLELVSDFLSFFCRKWLALK